MIARIAGKLIKLESDSCLIEVGPISYEIMLPGYCVAELAGQIDSEIELCTMEYYEGNPGGSSFVPRIVGFLTAAEKDFFTRFISVKGIGIKKGLRLLSIPISAIATAIEEAEDKTLLSLPGIGKRMSHQIIAELQGKLQPFATTSQTLRSHAQFKDFQTEALEILIAWGEKRNESMELIELACKRHPKATTAEEIVPLVYRLKQGAEV